VKKKPIRIFKKTDRFGRFQFYKSETEKTEPNPNWKKQKKNRAKPSQNQAKLEKNRAKTEPNKKNQTKPVWTGFCSKKPNRTEPKPVGLNQFWFFLKKIILIWLLFVFIKTKPNRKWSPLLIPQHLHPFQKKKNWKSFSKSKRFRVTLIIAFHIIQYL
jgi:hypothetical protein